MKPEDRIIDEELMLKGGTPDPGDFAYSVPRYNTELQVLYWLACQNEFKKDDALSLAIALVNGAWLAMGDEQVRSAVQRDTRDWLTYLRETNELQEQRGYHSLEGYPLEAKLCLVDSFNTHPFLWPGDYLLWQDYVQWGYVNHRRLDLPGYEYNTLNVTTLRRMREVMDEKGWIASDVKKTIENLAEYFYFNLAPLGSHSAGSTNLVYVYWYVKPYTIQRRNVDSIFSNFTRTQKLYGGCVEETELIRGFLQSWGIASDSLNRHDLWTTGIDHNYNIFFDPETRTWRAYIKQLELLDSGATMSTVVGFFFYRGEIIRHNSAPDGQKLHKNSADRRKQMAGPVGFEPTAPGLPRSIAGLEGRCFGHPGFGSAGAVQAELRARYAHTGLLPISAFFSAIS